MAFPFVPLAIGAGIAGQILGGKDQPGQLPPEVLAEILRAVKLDRSSMYIPDRDTFMAGIQANIDEILSGIAPGVEAFNADLASRGIFRSGEAPKELYRNVYAPIARAATSAATQGAIGYEQLRIQGASAAQQQALQALQLLVQGSVPTGGQTSAFQDTLFNLGDLGTTLGLMKAFGLMGGGAAA